MFRCPYCGWDWSTQERAARCAEIDRLIRAVANRRNEELKERR